MKFGIFLGLAIAATLPVVAMPSLAQRQTSINELRQSSPGITLSGRVVSVVGNDFILDDGTGQIIVDAGPRWWQEIEISEGEELTVTGEVGRSGELDAFSIVRSDGSVMNIRPSQGPPPWAGGPNRRN
ncbi:NirD/YgiW/YdeI family stress tolerance protein [Thermocoleostomius sinensis]|jgi:RNase P/RNase MRP subunit p29|uniref:NirD/YgiW/YdeI family stress tolerance protein n=1 Tax=Thermocoleostomius sinensis A174 TaxID=2016057 RepID=A0A9E8ZFS0_9CYAN|nr:NirD/YgiW/YdeI family stress tolerance protein [Thermocoleostomius sinensis]WAL62323.1 NirD/YgiW/YdeI family stress tolerance protein [Thermocoleostomius sinensis A174]